MTSYYDTFMCWVHCLSDSFSQELISSFCSLGFWHKYRDIMRQTQTQFKSLHLHKPSWAEENHFTLPTGCVFAPAFQGFVSPQSSSSPCFTVPLLICFLTTGRLDMYLWHLAYCWNSSQHIFWKQLSGHFVQRVTSPPSDWDSFFPLD